MRGAYDPRPSNDIPWNVISTFHDLQLILVYHSRARLHELFLQIEKEFEVLYMENVNCK